MTLAPVSHPATKREAVSTAEAFLSLAFAQARSRSLEAETPYGESVFTPEEQILVGIAYGVLALSMEES